VTLQLNGGVRILAATGLLSLVAWWSSMGKLQQFVRNSLRILLKTTFSLPDNPC